MKKGPGFLPTEIIFSATDACNLKCPHCFVKKTPLKLEVQTAVNFINSCKDTSIEKIGFSGGEPFLYTDFICQITKTAVENDLLFDQIMTNGVWWQTEDQLNSDLQKVYDSGFDGKIGLSYDSFHNQNYEKILTFINTVFKIWNDKQMISIQSVIPDNTNDKITDLENIERLSQDLNCQVSLNLNKKTGKGIIILQNEDIFMPVFRELQSFQSNDKRTWQSKKWFKDDFCQGPGQILFIHPDGNIAPCCGFSNENKELFIGNISQPLSKIMENADLNPMIQICYKEGLSKQIKKLKKKIPGKTEDLCAFCDFVCKNL